MPDTIGNPSSDVKSFHESFLMSIFQEDFSNEDFLYSVFIYRFI